EYSTNYDSVHPLAAWNSMLPTRLLTPAILFINIFLFRHHRRGLGSCLLSQAGNETYNRSMKPLLSSSRTNRASMKSSGFTVRALGCAFSKVLSSTDTPSTLGCGRISTW